MAELGDEPRPGAPLFLPYLSGERTPHADPAARGAFIGLSAACTRDDLAYAVIEGVCFGLADGLAALLDRRIGVLAAVLTSWRVLLENPGPMALWAFIIMTLTGFGMVTALAGLVFVLPWLAHASWHAYRDLVSTAGLEERT